jgi:hypothetical protein
MPYTLQPEFKAAWIAALRSGEYKQGYGKLYDSDTKAMCCLGVGCVVAGVPLEDLDDLPMPTPDMIKSWFNNPDTLPFHLNLDDAVDAINFSATIPVFIGYEKLPHPTNLPELNDDEGYSFEQIADIIEEQY